MSIDGAEKQADSGAEKRKKPSIINIVTIR
jgi:hypothetical protein